MTSVFDSAHTERFHLRGHVWDAAAVHQGPQTRDDLGMDEPLCGTVPCAVGCGAASLASAH